MPAACCGEIYFATLSLNLAMRLENKYKIKIICSDDYDVYKKYQIAQKHLMPNPIFKYTLGSSTKTRIF
jgi:hypothetical protein